MTEPKTKEDGEKCGLEPEDYEHYIDPTGMTHWLPPWRCRNCED